MRISVHINEELTESNRENEYNTEKRLNKYGKKWNQVEINEIYHFCNISLDTA